VENSGERGRNRTYNLLIKSQLLCQLSYAPALFSAASFDFSICRGTTDVGWDLNLAFLPLEIEKSSELRDRILRDPPLTRTVACRRYAGAAHCDVDHVAL
jgi:hypothetical protein